MCTHTGKSSPQVYGKLHLHTQRCGEPKVIVLAQGCCQAPPPAAKSRRHRTRPCEVALHLGCMAAKVFRCWRKEPTLFPGATNRLTFALDKTPLFNKYLGCESETIFLSNIVGPRASRCCLPNTRGLVFAHARQSRNPAYFLASTVNPP